MDPITSFLGETPKGKKYRRRAEVIIVNNDGKLFVGVNKDGDYILPGGGLGKKEKAVDAAKREATEEIKINCKNLSKLDGPFVIDLPDMYGGEKDRIDEDHKRWYERHNLAGHIIYTYRAEFSSKSIQDLGPKDDKYKAKLVTPEELIEHLKERIKELPEPKLGWRVKWETHTLSMVEKVKDFIEGNSDKEEE